MSKVERRKTMKKTKRTLLCLILAVLMVVSCAFTAMAASGTSTVTVNGTEYTYNWSVTRRSTYGTGTMATRGTPAYLTVEVRNYMYSDVNNTHGYNEKWASNTGYSSVATTANNILKINGVNVPSSVISTNAKFYIGSTQVSTQNGVV
ncbi:hypothetical protein [Phocaeicola sp.]|uniref:hypothetical protein n=1 Tax=Phocaeicola sp. TaxID=2773926 RepID=UPI0038706369